MSEFATVGDLAKEVTAYIAQLQAENAKLRELAHRVCGYIQFMQDTGKRDFELEELIIDMSRELGIEMR